MVEISGLATGPYTMLAPVTGRPCFYYRTLVWEWKQRGKNKEWVKIAGECMHVPFFIDDNTGRVLVDPRGADLELHRDFEQEFCDSFFTTKEPAPERVRRFLTRHGVITNHKIKVEEFCIKPKNALFVLGMLAENTDVVLKPQPQPVSEDEAIGSIRLGSLSLPVRPMYFGGGTEEGISSEAVLASSGLQSNEVVRLPSPAAPANSSEMTQQQKIAAALIKAGISNPAAWAAAGVLPDSAAPIGILSDSRTGPEGTVDGIDAQPAVVLKKGGTNFLISWRSRQEVAGSLAWKSTLMIWAGPVLTLLSLYVLLNITKVVR